MLLLTVSVAALACGGGDPTGATPNPGPTPTPSPASLTIRAGDAQVGATASELPVAVSVVVKDATGQPFSGATVSFVIDSGGGSVSPGSVTTGSDGVASSTWTLGPSDGSNALVASIPAASGIAPAHFHATARAPVVIVLDTTTVQTTGAVLTFSRAGDSLSGVSLTIPSGAFSAPTRFSVRAERAASLTLPSGVRQLGPSWVVGTDGEFAAFPMALTLPARTGSDSAIAVFYYDDATGTLEGVPVVARDDSTVTLATRHFRADHLMSQVQRATFTARRSSRAGWRALAGRQTFASAAPIAFGSARFVVLSAPRAAITAPITTGFTPGLDDWEFQNRGTYRDRYGICAGMSIAELYYYYSVRRGGGPGLYHRFDTWVATNWDNPDGEALASLLNVAQDWNFASAWLGKMQAYAQRSRVPYAQLAFESLAVTMQMSRQPQLLALMVAGTNGQDVPAHAVTVFALNGGTLSYEDPNAPATTQTEQYAAGAFAPMFLERKANDPPEPVTTIHFLGVSALVNLPTVAQYFADFQAGTIVSQAFPSIVQEYYDQIASKWTPLPAAGTPIFTTFRALALRTRCLAGCSRVRPARPGQISTGIKDSVNFTMGGDLTDADTAAFIVYGRGPGTFRFEMDAFEEAQVGGTFDFQSSYVGSSIVTVQFATLAIDPDTAYASAYSDVTLRAVGNGIPVASTTFEWDFGDGSPLLREVGDSTAVHQWAVDSSYTVTLSARNPAGKLLARATSTVNIAMQASIVWQLSSASVSGVSYPAAGIGPYRSDTLTYNAITGWLSRLQATPNHVGLMVFGLPAPGNGCLSGLIVQEWPTAVPTFFPVLTWERALLAICGAPADYTGSFSMGPLGNGTVVGSAAEIPQPDQIEFPGGSINAIMNGKTLIGSFIIITRFSTGTGQYTVSFSATQVRP